MEVILIFAVIVMIGKAFGLLKKQEEDGDILTEPFGQDDTEVLIDEEPIYTTSPQAPTVAPQPKPFLSEPHPKDDAPLKKRTTPNKQPDIPAPPTIEPLPEAESDFAIHSAEEARKAIIWGEILQRKY